MTTITKDATTITPQLVLGYRAESQARNVLHDILGRADADVSLREETLRAGTLSMLFLTKADAFAAYAFHTAGGTFSLADADVPEANMAFVRQGAMSIELDPQTRNRWVLEVGFQEVLA